MKCKYSIHRYHCATSKQTNILAVDIHEDKDEWLSELKSINNQNNTKKKF